MYDLYPAAVGIVDVKAARVRSVVKGTTHVDTQPMRTGQYVLEPVGVDIEGDLIRIGACAAELGGEEDEENAADTKRFVRSGERLCPEQVSIEGSETSCVRAAESDVVDAENAHGTSAYRRRGEVRCLASTAGVDDPEITSVVLRVEWVRLHTQKNRTEISLPARWPMATGPVMPGSIARSVISPASCRTR